MNYLFKICPNFPKLDLQDYFSLTKITKKVNFLVKATYWFNYKFYNLPANFYAKRKQLSLCKMQYANLYANVYMQNMQI